LFLSQVKNWHHIKYLLFHQTKCINKGGKTEVFEGMVIVQGPRDPGMPLSISLPKILVLSCDIPPASSPSNSLVFQSAGMPPLEKKLVED
jgi:hypothetical protein